MIRKITQIRNERTRARVRTLMVRGKIKKYSLDGYVAYDTDEFKKYNKTKKIGRPIKNEEETIIIKKEDNNND